MQRADKGRIVVGIGKIDDFRENRMKVKNASRAGRELLKVILREEFGVDVSKEEKAIGRDVWGKPFLKYHEDLFFNISHSGDYAACALGRVQVGIDIQYHKAVNVEKMGRKILSEEEWGAFKAEGCLVEGFYSFWTKKESFLKYTGEGIRRDLKGLEYGECRFFELDFCDGYSGKICVPKMWDGEIVVREWEI
ncbi:MAG: 4'-phosphopantetheinyl transferase superfamily protein [Clostridiales bacterium]|nr:4'-phosphopantetheinyl transferase superfamily protein [Clostridiales bacterium]